LTARICVPLYEHVFKYTNSHQRAHARSLTGSLANKNVHIGIYTHTHTQTQTQTQKHMHTQRTADRTGPISQLQMLRLGDGDERCQMRSRTNPGRRRTRWRHSAFHGWLCRPRTCGSRSLRATQIATKLFRTRSDQNGFGALPETYCCCAAAQKGNTPVVDTVAQIPPVYLLVLIVGLQIHKKNTRFQKKSLCLPLRLHHVCFGYHVGLHSRTRSRSRTRTCTRTCTRTRTRTKVRANTAVHTQAHNTHTHVCSDLHTDKLPTHEHRTLV